MSKHKELIASWSMEINTTSMNGLHGAWFDQYTAAYMEVKKTKKRWKWKFNRNKYLYSLNNHLTCVNLGHQNRNDLALLFGTTFTQALSAE